MKLLSKKKTGHGRNSSRSLNAVTELGRDSEVRAEAGP